MKARANPRRWAAGWLHGIALAVRARRVPIKALRSAAARARQCGLTDVDIKNIIRTRQPAAPES